MKRNRKGFTLVELVIVIAVIAILAAVLLPTFSNVIENAKQSSATQSATNAFKAYYGSDAIASVSDTYDTMADYAKFNLYVINGAGADYKFTIKADGGLELIAKGTFDPTAFDPDLAAVTLASSTNLQASGRLDVYGYNNVYVVAATTQKTTENTTGWTANTNS